MANEVKTVFTADASQLFRIADDVEKRLKTVFTQPAAFAKPQTDLALQYANRDIKQIEAARIRSQKVIEAEVAKSEKAITALKIREIKTVNDAALREAKRVQQQQAFGGGGSREFLSQVGSSVPFVGNIISGAASGGAAGASAAIVLTTVNAVKELTTEVARLSVEAVKLSADFQGSVNAMTVFTGSTRLAKQELASIADLAKNTTGLRLTDAEQGTTRLRALGFTAETTKDLLVGISKQKIINNADEQAVSRVIVNLTQLKAGSSQVGRDVKELIHAMPALNVVIKDAFGSLEKFQKALQENPDAALKKLAAGMKNVQAPAAGLNDSVDKLKDSIIKFARTVGEPILDPLTTDTKNLTTLVEQNTAAWRGLGQAIADTFEGAGGIKGVLDTLRFAGGLGASAVRNVIGQIPGGQSLAPILDAIAAGQGSLEEIGRRQREARERKTLRSDFENFYNGIPSQEKANTRKIAEIAAESDYLDTVNRLREKSNKEELTKLDDKFKSRLSLSESAFKREEALIRSHLDITKADELNTIKAVAELRQREARERIAELEQSFRSRYQFLPAGEQETARVDLFNEIKRIQIDADTARIQSLGEIARKQREIDEERKKKAEEYKKQLGEIRSLITSNFTQSSQNPYVKIFDDAAKAIERARELTRGFSKDIQQAAIQSARAANGGSLFGQRIDTRLQADSLQQQALRFLGGAVGRRELTGADIINGQIRNPVFETVYSGGNFSNTFTAEQKKIQDDLRRQIELVRSTPFSDIQGLKPEDRQRLINNSIADLVKGLNAEDLSGDLRGQAAQALLRQASDKVKEEAAAAQFYEKMNAIITSAGLKVTGATSNIEVTSRDLSVETQQQQNPARAVRNDVKDAMGNYRQAGKYYD